MTDIHAHILPWIDDGAENMDHAVEMARIVETEGITSICVTPHCNIPRQYEIYFGEYYKELFLHTKREFQRMWLSVNLYPGMEVFATPDLPNLIASGKILTLNQSRYLLVEFDFFEDPEFVFAILEKIREMKLIPIVAHPERYEFVQEDPERL